jgi:mono/diheme cytochrome c family protein
MHTLLPLRPARALTGAAVALLAFASACTYSKGVEPSPCTDTTPVTYAAVISPIFDTNCRACHGATVYQTLGGGNDYSTYQGIKNQSASLILGCIQHQAGYDPMPKGGEKISVCDIAKIKAWIDAGQPNN